MKNLKKLISVVLTIAMMASFLVVGTSAASYPDVESTKGYYAAVELLSALDILKGDEQGNFNPDAEIKRSEFAAVICRALGQENAATSLTSKFVDVAPEHWAVGYIGWAAGKGIVNGYGDGTFAPDKAVSYQEAVKMIMAALGYTPLAENKGGYPYGYLALAGTYGVTAGVNADPAVAASRSLVAQLVYNALEAPIMDSSYFSTTEERFVIYDGSKAADYEERTILSQYLDIISLKAKVNENYITDKNEYIAKDGRQLVGLEIIKFNNESDEEYYEDLLVEGEEYPVFVGETDAADFLTKTVDAYAYYNEDEELVLKAIVESKKATKTVVINAIDIAAINEGDEPTVEYWEDAENDKKPEELEIAADADIYVNGEKVGAIDGDGAEIFAALDAVDGTIEFVGAKAGKFEAIFVTEYEYYKVAAVNADEEVIELEDAAAIELAEEAHEDETFVYNIYKDGKAADFDAIEEGDVLTLVYPGNDYNDTVSLDIYVSSATVEGRISKVANDKYYIDGEAYASLTEVEIGDEGIFFLTHDGRIFDVEEVESASNNYAYVLKSDADETAISVSAYVKLITKDGAIKTYKVADKVKAFGEKIDTNKEADIEAFLDFFKGATAEEEVGGTLDALEGNEALITFEVNADDEITTIAEIEEVADLDEKAYSDAKGKLGKYYFDEETVVFYIPEDGEVDDYAVISAKALKDGESYTGNVYNAKNNVMGALVINSSLGFAGENTALALVTATTTALNSEDETATEITVFQAGETASYIVADDELEFAVGNIIQFVTNAAGEISQAAVVYDGEAIDDSHVTDEDITFEAGYVVNINKGLYVISDDMVYDEEADYEEDEFMFNYEDGCTLAMVDVAKEGRNGYVKGLTSAASFRAINKYGAERTVYYMVARLVDGEIVDAIEFNLGVADFE